MNNGEAARFKESQIFKEADMHEALKYVQHVLIALENTPTENIPTSGHRQRLALRKLSDKQRIFGFIEDVLLKVSAGKAITASNNSEMVIKLREALEYYLQAGHKEDRRIASIKAKEALQSPPITRSDDGGG